MQSAAQPILVLVRRAPGQQPMNVQPGPILPPALTLLSSHRYISKSWSFLEFLTAAFIFDDSAKKGVVSSHEVARC